RLRRRARRHQPSEESGPGVEERILRRRRSMGGRRMGRRRNQGTSMRLAALLALVCSGLSAQDANFKIDVQLVRLLVTVKNPVGDLVGSLDKRDFAVFDKDVPQD